MKMFHLICPEIAFAPPSFLDFGIKRRSLLSLDIDTKVPPGDTLF
jgi:hypothetical protein